MASLKDRTGYGDGSQGSHDVEFLPLVADVVGWIGLIVWQPASSFSLGRAWRLCSGVARHPLWLPLVLDRLRRPKSRLL